ncbi:MAG: polysaccharide deacetylase family protein [Rhizobiales bacterium]|nr:polysaccharide deacetylase family protein [Hyphomicrobiales bacterium]
MRLAIAACAIALAIFAWVFGYHVIGEHALSGPEPAARVAMPSPESRPAQTVAVVSEAAPAVAPAPTDVSPTVAQGTAAAAPPARAASPASCPGNPDALGVARTVEIDTSGGPGFGFEHFRQHDFLQPGEVVLTYDDGPWPHRTMAVINALAAHCTRAIFFPIGKHATYEPGILKQVAVSGHTVGSHTWSHQNLASKPLEDGKREIEKGISAVALAVGGPVAPFFRFPALRHPPELVSYLGERNIAIFSTDMDSFDFKMRKPEQVRQSVMAKLKKFGKGIVLMHDFQQSTASATADLLNDLKAGGYKIVHMRARTPVTTIAAYDEEVRKDAKLPTVSTRPTSSVVRTINE